MPGRPLRKGIRKTTYPAVAAVSLLALANPIDQLPGNTAHARATHEQPVAAPGEPSAARPVDGGHPLFLKPPPPRPNPDSTPAPGEPSRATSGPPGAAGPTAATLPAFGIPATVLGAYRRAEDRVGQTIQRCHLSWPVLAGIGKVESNHARNGDVTPDGELIDPIYGPALDGSSGFAAISDRTGWARAAGPMQFIPSTWATWGTDGNGDGKADVQNVFDSALAAADYLCADGRDLGTGPGLRDAILSYNHSQQYLDTVAAWIRAYQNNGGPIPDQPYGPGTFPDASEVSGTAPPGAARPGQPGSGAPPSGQPGAAPSGEPGSGGAPSPQPGSGVGSPPAPSSGTGSSAPPVSGGTGATVPTSQSSNPLPPAPAPNLPPPTHVLPPPPTAPAPVNRLPGAPLP